MARYGLSRRSLLAISAVLILFSLIMALPLLWQRYSFDRANRTVYLVVDGDDLGSLAAYWGEKNAASLADPVEVWAVALSELSLEDALRRGLARWEGGRLVATSLPLDSKRQGCHPWEWADFSSGGEIGFQNTPWGFDPSQRWMVDEFPHLLWRVRNHFTLRDRCLGLTLDLATRGGLVIFEGTQVLGYPDQLDQVAEEIAARGSYFGKVEFGPQDGDAALAARLGERALVVHSISDPELVHYGVEDAVARYVRAVRERGVRVLYLNLFTPENATPTSGGRGLGPSMKLIDELSRRLRVEGYRLASASERLELPLEMLELGRADRGWRLALALLALGFGFWMLELSLPLTRPWRLYLVLGLALLVLLGGTVSSYLGRELSGLIVGFSAPLIGVLVGLGMLTRSRISPLSTLYAFLAANLITLAGGLVIYALFSTPAGVLRQESLRGITLLLLLPLLVLAANFWRLRDYASTRSVYERIERLLAERVSFTDLAVMGLLLVGVAVMVIRSGNEAAGLVSQLELALREKVEALLAVRPRTKELLGQPMLFLAAAALAGRRETLAFLALMAFAVAEVSVLNTFLHNQTPILVSLIRVGLGMAWGLVVGLILYWLADLVLRRLGRGG